MVDVVVAEEDPADILRVDEREDVLEVAVAECGHPGVDQDRFGAPDHHRVQVHGDGRHTFSLCGSDDEGVGCDLDRRVSGRSRRERWGWSR